MVLVCVKNTETFSRLVKAGRGLAKMENLPLKVI